MELSNAGDSLLRQSFAGDVFNTLWYARAALGEDWSCRFFTALGSDPVSDQMIAFISGAGIDTTGIGRISDRRPGLYMIHLEGAERSFSYWRENSAARLLGQDRDGLMQAIEDASLIYLSGITLAIMPAEDVAFLLDRLHSAVRAGRTVAFDPNIRPALWQDRTDMCETIQRAADCATIVLPGFDDEKNAFGDAGPVETLERYSAAGKGMVVLKDGAGTVRVRSDSDVMEFKTSEVTDAVDTTGAGDSFNGAFLARFAETGDVGLSVEAGQSCAAQVIRHRGALVPHEALISREPANETAPLA